MDTINVPQIIEAQSRQAIVFRQHFPPSFNRGLSYFGGAPTADAEFIWPRWQDPQGNSRPLTFIMQIDCSAIPTTARLGVMPDDGVLYVFMEISESLLGSAYRVIYQAGPTDGWSEITLPEDLPPTSHLYYCKYAMKESQLPRILPRWDFTPTAINIPPESYTEREDDEPFLWSGLAVEELRAAQGGRVIHNYYSVEDFIPEKGVFRKPFETFPHDWRAVQYLMAMMLERLDHCQKYPNSAYLDKSLSDEEKRLQLSVIQEKAQLFYDLASGQPTDEAVPESHSDTIWTFLASHEQLSRYFISEAVTLSVEDSLSRSPQAASLIPPAVAERIHGRHALVITNIEGKEHARTPERMLSPPTDVQGGQWEWANTHLLLLQLSSHSQLGREFGEGVCQLYITPDDLKARRFDKVKQCFEAY